MSGITLWAHVLLIPVVWYLSLLLLLAGFLKLSAPSANAIGRMRAIGLLEVILAGAITQPQLGPLPSALTWVLFSVFLGVRLHSLVSGIPCECFSTAVKIQQDREAAVGTGVLWWLMIGVVTLDRFIRSSALPLEPAVLGLPLAFLLSAMLVRRISQMDVTTSSRT